MFCLVEYAIFDAVNQDDKAYAFTGDVLFFVLLRLVRYASGSPFGRAGTVGD